MAAVPCKTLQILAKRSDWMSLHLVNPREDYMFRSKSVKPKFSSFSKHYPFISRLERAAGWAEFTRGTCSNVGALRAWNVQRVGVSSRLERAAGAYIKASLSPSRAPWGRAPRGHGFTRPV